MHSGSSQLERNLRQRNADLQQLLTDGDRIQLGESLFLFISKAAGAPTVPVTLSQGEPSAATLRLEIEDSTYLRDGGVPSPEASRKEHHLQALLKIATAMNSTRKEEEVQALLLDLLADVVPGDQLAILRPVHGDATPVAQACRPATPSRLDVNGRVLRQSLEERIAVLTTDGPSILCAPLVARGRTLGAIYVTSSRPHAFDQEHLQLTVAIAAIAAVAIDNAQHLAALQEEAERVHSDSTLEHNLIGRAPKMVRVLELIAEWARTNSTVLLTGETGPAKSSWRARSTATARAPGVRSSRSTAPH